MSKATIAYVLMFATLIAGLWTILRIGGRLQAPPDLRGTWQVRWEGAGASGSEPFEQLTLAQSGLFLEILLDNRTTLRGRFHREGANQLAGNARSSDGHWALDLRLSEDKPPQLLGKLQSPAARSFMATRTDPAAGSAASQPDGD